MKTAIVIGATGLTGAQLVNQLLKDSRFEKIKVFVRKTTGIVHQKLQEHIVDFNKPETFKDLVRGDVLYSAMGTTLKSAGSKEAQYVVDYTYQYNMAKMAATNGVSALVLVSSAGANTSSSIFYSRIKGELERDVQLLQFKSIHIFRPGMLAGPRKEHRGGEKIGIAVMNLVSKIPGLGALKPILGAQVAQAMINATFKHDVGIYTYSLGEVFKLAGNAA